VPYRVALVLGHVTENPLALWFAVLDKNFFAAGAVTDCAQTGRPAVSNSVRTPHLAASCIKRLPIDPARSAQRSLGARSTRQRAASGNLGAVSKATRIDVAPSVTNATSRTVGLV